MSYNIEEAEAERISPYIDPMDDKAEINLPLNDLHASSVGLDSSGNPLEPVVGMEFNKLDDVRAFYNAYARRKGFGIRTNHTRLSKVDKSLIGLEYACSREGVRRSNYEKKGTNRESVETRIGCKASMAVKKVGEIWVVSKFVLEHNHELLTPKSTSLLRGHRAMSRAQKNLINTLSESGVSARKIMSVSSKESGSEYEVGCTTKDIQNYFGTKGRSLLREGDAQRMYDYFLESQCKNPGFIYAVQVDENGCMGNCFWADARSRADYQYFGDVVTFDASYLTNHYKIPFVPFTGINHHHQSVMFGCALLVNETTESYTWLLRIWLEAMLGRAPATIITDDDNAMAKAISEVLPNTTHRLCLWHILQKVPEHLAHIYDKYSHFQRDFHHCIHQTLTIEEFEVEWNELIMKFGLKENDWLASLYMRREKWAPAYLRTFFFAGMSTTQWSESMNKFFKDFVRSSTMVSEFVHQYEKALDARYLKEKEKDVKTKTSQPILKTYYRIEAEAARVYTRKSFFIFQEELTCSQKYKVSKDREEEGKKIYRVVPSGRDHPTYEVALEISEAKATCTCHMFEYIGILCRHILGVFAKKCLMEVLPEQYVLNRWTMNAKSRRIHGITSDEAQGAVHVDSTRLKSNLMMQFYEIAELGSQSISAYEHIYRSLENCRLELLSMQDTSNENASHVGIRINNNSALGSQVLSNFTLQDPPHASCKGRPKSVCQKNPRENQPAKKRKCGTCKNTEHARNTCPHRQARDVNLNAVNTNLDPLAQQNFHECSFTASVKEPQDPMRLRL